MLRTFRVHDVDDCDKKIEIQINESKINLESLLKSSILSVASIFNDVT